MNGVDLKKTACCLLLCLAVWAVTSVAPAEETGIDDPADYEDVLSGFDDSLRPDPVVEEITTETARTPSRYHLGGAFTLASTWNVNHNAPPPGQTDFRGLSRLRAELDLNFKADFYESWRAYVSGRGFYDFAYAIQGRDEYTGQVLDEYESELEFRETYLQGSLLPYLDLTVGRQIIVWGNTENFRVTDVLNPVDNRDPGLVDIEHRRLPVCAVKADLYWDDSSGRYSLTGLAIPELRYDKNPVYGYDFYPFEAPMPPDDTPSTSLGNTGLAMALTGIFHNWDLSLYAACFHDHVGYIKQNVRYVSVMTPIGEFEYPEISFERRFSRLKMTGLSANFVVGSWLLKTEMAWTGGYEYSNAEEDKSRLDMLAGVEYMGFSNTTLTLEFMQEYILGFERRMMMPPDNAEQSQFTTALRINRKWMNDRLEAIVLAMVMGGEADEGALERLSLAYDINDALKVTGGCVLYQGGDAMKVDHIHRNNRLFFDIKYSF